MGFLRNAELPGEVVAALGQLLGLGPEEDGVDDHAVTDDVGFAALEDTRRDGAEHVFFAAELQRMAGIGAALEARHHLVAGRQYIHDLAFALVAPLQSEDHVDFFHYNFTLCCNAKDVFAVEDTKSRAQKQAIA